jgi:D-alanyl-D-alanine dipeptidase
MVQEICHQLSVSGSGNILFLDDLRNHKIPEIGCGRTALDYHEIPINLVSVFNRESVVDLRNYGIACKSAYSRALAPYYRSFGSALQSVHVRESVAEKLAQANDLLRAYNVELLALDGFRSIELQHELWEHFIEKGREILEQASAEELVKFAGQFCSDPRGFDENDFRTWPVHNTGGAIDLTLVSLIDGQELYMGSIFDDADSVSSTRFYETSDFTSQSALEARRNRRLLYHVMASAGFANYPHEWWHFDYGTQMWVMNGGHDCHAHYGRSNLA